MWLGGKAVIERVFGADRVDRFLDRLMFYEIKSRLVRFKMDLPDGNVITYRPYDKRIIKEVYEGGYREVQLSPGDCVLDIGGNIGSFTLLAARRVGPGGRVITAEPDPENASLLALNLRNNNLTQVSFIQAAVSDKVGTMKLYRSGDPGMHSLVYKFPRSVTVAVETLDTIAEKYNVGRVALVKIDVEGAEALVLAGGAKVLARTDQIILETDPSRAKDVLAQFERFGFVVKHARDNNSIFYAVSKRLAAQA